MKKDLVRFFTVFSVYFLSLIGLALKAQNSCIDAIINDTRYDFINGICVGDTLNFSGADTVIFPAGTIPTPDTPDLQAVLEAGSFAGGISFTSISGNNFQFTTSNTRMSMTDGTGVNRWQVTNQNGTQKYIGIQALGGSLYHNGELQVQATSTGANIFETLVVEDEIISNGSNNSGTVKTSMFQEIALSSGSPTASLTSYITSVSCEDASFSPQLNIGLSSSIWDGMNLIVKRVDNFGGNLTIDPLGIGHTIDGNATYTITEGENGVHIVFDFSNTNWVVVSELNENIGTTPNFQQVLTASTAGSLNGVTLPAPLIFDNSQPISTDASFSAGVLESELLFRNKGGESTEQIRTVNLTSGSPTQNINAQDNIILVTCENAAFSAELNLPDGTFEPGQKITIKRIDNNATDFTITTGGSTTIDGQSSITTNNNLPSLEIVQNLGATNVWYIISKYDP